MSTSPLSLNTAAPWSQEQRLLWGQQQRIKRSYADEVLSQITALNETLDLTQYGALPWDVQRYPVYALHSKNWNPALPTVLITGGVHGYETSGVHGALGFCQEQLPAYTRAFNFVVIPCVSPWGYETINRWNPLCDDPNRSFKADMDVPEAALLMQYLRSVALPFTFHIDLHETTDTDNSQFRPALAARDGIDLPEWGIPDGFYLVTDSANQQLLLQQAMIARVAQVTHIAAAEADGGIIGEPLLSPGVIAYDYARLGLCAGVTGARFVSTTEVYPDSARVTAALCNQAQIAAVCGGLDYLQQLPADQR